MDEIKTNLKEDLKNFYLNPLENNYYQLLKAYFQIEENFDRIKNFKNDYKNFLMINIKDLIKNSFKNLWNENKMEIVFNFHFNSFYKFLNNF